MNLVSARSVKRFLRRPSVVVTEMAAITLTAAVGAAVPQAGTVPATALERLRGAGHWAAAVVDALGLDHIFRGVWFVGLCLLVAASLCACLWDSLSRLRARRSRRPAVGGSEAAPYRAVFDRPRRSGDAPGARAWTIRRLGLAGSPALHGGLLLLMVGGALRALFGSSAIVDLMEGETLPPSAQAWSAQWPGALAAPVTLDTPLVLRSVTVSRHADGELRELRARVDIPAGDGPHETELAVNRGLSIRGQRVFLGSDYGVTALMEWRGPDAAVSREAVLLQDRGRGRFEGDSTGPDGLVAHLRAEVGAAGEHPRRIEVRVMKGRALANVADLRVGGAVQLPEGATLSLHGVPFWIRLRGARDYALWLAYAGFALVMVGAALLYAYVPLDAWLSVTSIDERRERVELALRPHRFPACFAEFFDRLVIAHGGPDRSCVADVNRVVSANEAAVQGVRPATLGAGASPLVRTALFLLCGVMLAGCRPARGPSASEVVRRYNDVVAEAYRRGDVKLIDPVVGPNEGRKLTGLIGVRLDMGVTLDSELMELTVTREARTKDEWRVWTSETWRYRDRRIGSGEPVAEPAEDSYKMLYVLKPIDGTWRVDEIVFAEPPQVGRKQALWLAERNGAGGGGAGATARTPSGPGEGQP